MALTVTDQRSIINECDATTSWTGTATVSLFTTEPSPIESGGCLGMVVSNATENAYVTVTAVDFTAGNSPGPSLIYAWIFHRAELDITANGGLMIQLGDGTNRVGFHVAGADVDGFRHSTGPVGWQCLVLDTADLPTATTTFAGSAGSLDFTAITQIGVAFKTLVKAVGGVANCFWDILRRGAVGQGLLITGGTVGDPGTWEQLALADRGIGDQQAYGVVRQLGTGVFGVQGSLAFGDSAGTDASYFRDANVTVVFEDRRVDTDKYQLTVQGNATGSTTWWHENSSIVVPSTRAAAFVASDADLQVLNAIGTTFAGFTQGFALSADATNAANHQLTGCTIRRCAQVQAGRVPIRTTLFTGHADTDAALLWNANIDVADCQFQDNTDATNDPAGIEHDAGGTVDYDNLTFSGNDFDVYLSHATASLTVNLTNGSNATTKREGGTGAITFVPNPATLLITVQDIDTSAAIQGARVLVLAAAGGPFPADVSVAITRSGSVATVTHATHGLTTGNKVRIDGADQQEYNGIQTITVTGSGTYDYDVAGTPATPATGTVVVSSLAIIDAETNASGQVSDTRGYTSDQPFAGTVRKGTVAPVYQDAPISGIIDSTAGASATVPMIPD